MSKKVTQKKQVGFRDAQSLVSFGHDVAKPKKVVQSNKLSMKLQIPTIDNQDKDSIQKIDDEELRGVSVTYETKPQSEEVQAQPEDAEEAQQNNKVSQISYLSRRSAQERAGVKFPIGRMGKIAKQGRFADRISQGTPVFMAGVLEYLAFEIVELASKQAEQDKTSGSRGHKTIMPRHIMLAIKSDEELDKFKKGCEFAMCGYKARYLGLTKAGGKNKKKKGQLEDSDSEDDNFAMDLDQEMI